MSDPTSASIPEDLPDPVIESPNKGESESDPKSEATTAKMPESAASDDNNASNANNLVNTSTPTSDGLQISNVSSIPSSSVSGAHSSIATTPSNQQRYPIVRLNQLNMNETQLEGAKRKSTGILAKPLLSRRSASLESDGVVKAGGSLDGNADTESPIPIPQALSTTPNVDLPDPLETGVPGISSITPSIVKPRRASVHFAVDSESSTKPLGVPERVRQDSGGSSSSRKHRSRKEKLVCRSESPTASETNLLPLGPLFSSPGAQVSGIIVNPTPSTSSSSLPPAESKPTPNDAAKYTTSATMKPPPISTKSPTKAGSTSRVKPYVKRVSGGTGISRGGNSRKGSSNSLSSNASSGLREPTVKKKKVIEIVSPRKRKSSDHFDIVKTSSDPIFVRAANKPFKNKPFHNRLKFSRANLHKPNTTAFQHGFGGQRVRHPSSTGLQSSRVKQRLSGSPQKKEPEAESPSFPPAFVDDLVWLLQDAESEFGPLGRSSKPDSLPSVSNAQLADTILRGSTDAPAQLASGSTSTPSLLAFGRRRVDSEPPGTVGFEMAPGSPTGSPSFYQFRKDLYFSPSPNYTAAGPTGRRRYSRRRHAKIHPPFDDTNCNFQGHCCPNSRVLRSQYCEKHLDQGPATGFSHCRYMKDGKSCGSLVQSFDTYCEQHSNLIARAEYDARNPKVQPDQARNIIAKISKMFKEGLSKSTKDTVDTSTSVPDIFQIVEEPEIVQELPLGNYTGGLLEEFDVEGERNVNPDKPDYDALKNAGYFTTEEIIQIHINKLKKLKALYQREKELEWLTRQQKLRFFREGLEKLKQYGPRFTTNPYLINTKLALPPDYIDHQIKQYDAAKAILQTAYKADGQRGLLRLKMLQKTQELARKAKASGQKQHDAADVYDSDTDADSDGGQSREKLESTRYSGNKSFKCAYNEGYAVRACQNSPVYYSTFCLKHILSDTKQVQWIPCKRKIGPDPQDFCKTPCYRILEKYGCPLHSPLLITKHKPLRRSEEELNLLADSENEEEELTLENESHVLANLITDECLSVSHLEEALSQLGKRGPLEITDTSDSEETDEEVVSVGSLLTTNVDDDDTVESPLSGHS